MTQQPVSDLAIIEAGGNPKAAKADAKPSDHRNKINRDK